MAFIPTNMVDPPQLGSATYKNGLPTPADAGPYAITNTNWYKSLPYGFAFYDISSKVGDTAKSTMWLPISPNNLQVTTHFATNVITTLYGVVEEHSEVRYYDILIQGTTGFMPRFVAPFESGTNLSDFKTLGRTSIDGGSIPDLGGFLPEVTNTLSQALNIATDIGNAISGGPQNTSGIDSNKSGYVAFHNLYRFLLRYKNDAAQVGSTGQSTPSLTSAIGSLTSFQSTGATRQNHSLEFLNYKDGIKYDCVPLSFTLTRSADNPMLYNYSIRLRGFNLQNVHSKAPEANTLAELGLSGLGGNSTFSAMTSIMGSAATAISAIL